jgi:hypothetical protein
LEGQRVGKKFVEYPPALVISTCPTNRRFTDQFSP